MKKMCSHCYFYFTCEENEVCEDFTDCVAIEENEEEIERYIEDGRNEFYADWVKYILENEED